MNVNLKEKNEKRKKKKNFNNQFINTSIFVKKKKWLFI